MPASKGDLCCEQQGMCSDLPYTSSDCETGMVGQSQTFLAFFCMWYAIRVWDFYVKTTPKFQSCGQCERWPFNFVARSCGEIFQYSRTVCAESVQLGLSKWPLIHQTSFRSPSFPPSSFTRLLPISGQNHQDSDMSFSLLVPAGDCSANRTSVM